ncbi:MAG: hypothetical protein ACFE9P_05180, partial [Candidatus Hermodarchaeota archaeon]
MSYKEKIINKLRKGYSPIEVSPKDELTSTFKNIFKPIINRKDLEFFLDLFDTNEVILRAWSFLGIYYILEETKIKQEDKQLKIQNIILELLNDKREVYYYGGSSEIRTSLREHHVRRICELDNSLIFKPVFEYCKSFEGDIDNVIGELLENVVAKSADPSIEALILRYAKKIDKGDYNLKTHIVKAFENLYQFIELKERNSITELFKRYLSEIEEDKVSDQETLNNKLLFQKNIYRVAATLNLPLEEETLNFISSLKYPFDSLGQIAKTYKNNDKFKNILLKKLDESTNPRLITDILMAILVLKENVENWKELIVDNMQKYQIIDGSLIVEMQESNLLNENMILSFFNSGDNWSLNFIREFLVNNPEILDNWKLLKNEFIRILNLFEPTENNLEKKKELVLKLIIDLKEEDLVKYCLENFKFFEEENLKKLSLFPILKFGEESLLLKLKELMISNEDVAKFVKNFWN